MALNPYFLQGSSSEQRLVQDLINEQLRMYGQDIVYLPRKIVNKKSIIKEFGLAGLKKILNDIEYSNNPFLTLKKINKKLVY